MEIISGYARCCRELVCVALRLRSMEIISGYARCCRELVCVALRLRSMEIISGNEDSSPLDPCQGPLLFFDYDGPTPEQATDVKFFYSIPTRQLQVKSVGYLREHYYWTTPQGWMLMVHTDTRDTFLWNPFTYERIGLPLEQENLDDYEETRCLLSHKPTDPCCVVLVVDLKETVLWYCRPGGTRWSMHEYQPETELHASPSSVLNGMAALTTLGGKFYMMVDGVVVTLEFSPNPKFATIGKVDGRIVPAGYKAMSKCTLESCGELFVVGFCHPSNPTIRGNKIAKIVVYKLDLSKREFVKVGTLGDRLFFVNESYFGASLPAKEVGLKGNCIYFLNSEDKGLYVHDLERGSTALHNPGPDLPDDVSPELLMPAW